MIDSSLPFVMLVWRLLCGCGIHPSCCPGAGVCWDALGAGVAFVVPAFVVLAWPSSCFVWVVLSCSCCCEPCLLRWHLCWHLSCWHLSCWHLSCWRFVVLAFVLLAFIVLASLCWCSSCWRLSCWQC